MSKIKIYGSHNTMTYLRPLKWWMRIVNFAAKCQKLPLAEQVKYVDYIDIRLSVTADGVINLAHGWVVYDNIYLQELLKALSNYKGYCRVLWEDNYDKSNAAKADFIGYCNAIEAAYPNVKFVGGRQKSTWNVIYKFKHSDPALLDKYSSMDKKWLCWFPWLYAKLYNKQNTINYKQSDSSKILLQDFIEKE